MSKRSIHGWFLGFSSILLIAALGVLFSAASDLTEAALQFGNLTVKQPRFADFVGLQRYELMMKKMANKNKRANLVAAQKGTVVEEAPKALPAVGEQRLELNQAVQKGFEFFADYENKLSKLELQFIKPVVAAIEPGSPAESSGVKIGDTILMIGDTKIESVMGFYSALADRAKAEIPLRVIRDKRELNLFLRNFKGNIFSGNNTGIKFALPEDVIYITEQDAKKLAEQFKNDFLSTIPADWRTDAANNLMQMARQLSDFGTEMIDLNNSKPIRVKSSDLIAWQHKRWTVGLEDYFSQRRLLENKVIETLSDLGDALSGLVAALFLFGIALLSYQYRRSSQEKTSA